MKWKQLLLPPVAIYAVIFLFISALVGAKIDQEAMWVWITTLIITVVGLSLASRYAKPKNTKMALQHGVTWLVVLVVLDLILTAPFVGWDYFSDWRSYVPYVLTVLFPVGYVMMKK